MKFTLATGILAIASVPAATAVPHNKPAPPPKPYPGLNQLAHAAGLRYFGSAADIPGPEQQDAAYLKVLNNASDIGALVPTNYQKVCRSTLLKKAMGARADKMHSSGFTLSPSRTSSTSLVVISSPTSLKRTASMSDATTWFGTTSSLIGVSLF